MTAKKNIVVFFSTRLTRNSSEDKIANVNFLYDDFVHALQNTIDSYMNSARDRRGYVSERRFTKVSEITQSLRRSRSFKVTDFCTNRKLIYDFLVINLPPTLHRFQLWLIIDHIFSLSRGECLTLTLTRR